MAKPSADIDTSTILDHLFKTWQDQYPPEKTEALKDRCLSLDKTINELTEKYVSLDTAKCRLSNLHKPLSDSLNCLKDAVFSHSEFVKTYGDLGVSTTTPTETMEATISQYVGELKSYAEAVEKAYFSNLDSIRTHLVCISALRNLYSELFKAIATIRDSYFKTEPDRRKPVIRELYRIFNSIGSNNTFFGASPTLSDSLIYPKMDENEWNSLLALRKEAEKSAKVIKNAR